MIRSPKAPLSSLIAALAVLSAPPAMAQADNAAVLAQLEESLPGTLINDPTSLEWRTAGARLDVAAVVDPNIPGGGAATQYEVRRAGDNPWDMQAYVPLTASIAAGDTVTFGFWARTTESRAADGLGRVTARVQRDANPWPGFGDTPFQIGREWRWYEATTTANIAVPQREAFLVFQLAAEQQTVEIGQTFVVSGATQILGNNVRPTPPLPPQLEGRGTLISDPVISEWSFLDVAGSYEPREDGTIYLGNAVQMTSPGIAAQAWDLQAAVPITQPIATGDQLEIAVAAKTVSAATEDGRARVGVRVQQNGAPFAGFGDNTFTVGPNWQLVRIRTTATADMAQGSAVVALHFAGAEQVVDLGPVYVVKLNPGL